MVKRAIKIIGIILLVLLLLFIAINVIVMVQEDQFSIGGMFVPDYTPSKERIDKEPVKKPERPSRERPGREKPEVPGEQHEEDAKPSRKIFSVIAAIACLVVVVVISRRWMKREKPIRPKKEKKQYNKVVHDLKNVLKKLAKIKNLLETIRDELKEVVPALYRMKECLKKDTNDALLSYDELYKMNLYRLNKLMKLYGKLDKITKSEILKIHRFKKDMEKLEGLSEEIFKSFKEGLEFHPDDRALKKEVLAMAKLLEVEKNEQISSDDLIAIVLRTIQLTDYLNHETNNSLEGLAKIKLELQSHPENRKSAAGLFCVIDQKFIGSIDELIAVINQALREQTIKLEGITDQQIEALESVDETQAKLKEFYRVSRKEHIDYKDFMHKLKDLRADKASSGEWLRRVSESYVIDFHFHLFELIVGVYKGFIWINFRSLSNGKSLADLSRTFKKGLKVYDIDMLLHPSDPSYRGTKISLYLDRLAKLEP